MEPTTGPATGRVFLDTNILAYQFDNSQAAKQHRARQVFLELSPVAVISTQVMVELHAVLTRKLGISKEDAEEILRSLDVETVRTDQKMVLAAARTCARHQISMWDALILEAAVTASCSELWTEDLTAGSTLRGVTIVNPFSVNPTNVTSSRTSKAQA